MLKKTCLITGGGTRIGKEIALSLADKGYNIAIQYYKSKKEALITKEELLEKNVDAEIFYCNFKKQNSYQNLIQEIDQRFSNFEILINTSSLFQRKDIIETTTDDLKEIFEINFFAFYELLRTFCLSRNEGQIINLSDTKITQKSAAYGTYITSRLAAEKLIKIAASQFAPKFRINSIAKGYSGVCIETVQTMADMLNKGVHPIVREKGSVGSSGDLCPLAHMVLVLMGEGEAEYQGEVMSGAKAMELAGIKPVELKAKEGLGLINGTQAMMGVAVHAVYDSLVLLKSADIIGALTMEALYGVIDAFDPRLHADARPHSGQVFVAENINHLTTNSKCVTRQGEKRMQDAYTIRCIPQVHGASRLAIDYVKSVIETELNAATDNPLIFPEGDNPAAISGGNFHGQPIAIAMDTLGIAIAEYANISERRIERLVNPDLSGLPAFLVKNGGINTGFMVPQYAAASVVSENKILAHPASVDSIPTSANQEDHVSFGTIASRKARQIIEHTQYVLGIEWICAAQGIDFNSPEMLGDGTKKAYEILREKVTFMEDDRVLYHDQDNAKKLIADGVLLNGVEAVIGELK